MTGKGQGSTKLLSWLSEITETSISHENFSLEKMRKKPKNIHFGPKQVSVTENSFSH